MKKLFDDNERYTPEAMTVSSIARNNGIAAAFSWAIENGFSIRETSHIIQGEVMEQELSHVLNYVNFLSNRPKL